MDLRTEETISLESFESITTYNMSFARATDTFIESLLINSINKIKQPNNQRGCVPTTAAIIVDYHDRNLGKNNLISDNEADEEDIMTLRDFFVNKTNALNGSVSFGTMKTVLEDYIRSKGYRPSITYETTENNTGTLTAGDFYTVLAEITYNRPVMVIVGYDGFVGSDNPLSNSRSSLHALTVYGVKENLSGEYHYLKVYDSIDAKTREVIWDTRNGSRQYFAIYGVEYINIK